MEQVRTLRWLAPISACVLISNVALADNCTGYDFLTTQLGEVTEYQGHKLAIFKAHSTVSSENSIYTNAIGECVGLSVTTPDGKSQSKGYCVRVNKNGDVQFIDWAQPLGADKGSWKNVGFTGIFANRLDTGWFQPGFAKDKVSIVPWGGNCK